MKEFDNIIIGFGKGGKTLAGALAGKGERTALIERSDKMYGGTCINVACIPSKFLENSARLSAAMGGSFQEKAERYQKTILEKREVIGDLRQKNLAKAVGAGVEVITGTASFVDDQKSGCLIRMVPGKNCMERKFLSIPAQNLLFPLLQD